jgi:hypothetical protein
MTGFRMRVAGAAALLFSSLALAAPPPAPTVTVGTGLKQLRFDVEPVSGASFYRLWFRANGGATWVKYSETTSADPVFVANISSHLLDWWNARYKVSACNSSGCGTTADIYVTEHMRDTVGFFKPRAGAIDPKLHGDAVALSADGKALAVLSGETIGPRTNSVVVTVYRKGPNGWAEERRLVPSLPENDTADRESGRRLSINGDGTVVALGVPHEYALYPNHPKFRGAAYVFRKTGTTWAQEAKFADGETTANKFGTNVELDDAGQTLVVTRWSEYAPVDIYRRGTNGWMLEKQLTVPNDGTGCSTLALSGDGRVLGRSCTFGYANAYLEIREGAGWPLRQQVPLGRFGGVGDVSFDGSLIVASTGREQPDGATWTPTLMVLRRDGGTWQPDPAFTHVGRARGLPSGTVSLGAAAISRDGRFVAATDPGNKNGGTGVVRGPLTLTSEYTGAVFIYQRRGDAWALRNMIKPNVLKPGSLFGWSVAFGDDGKVFAVGAPNENSGARGIDGDQADASAPESGAVWLY